MIALIPRTTPAPQWQLATPLLAVLATMLTGGLLFAIMGYNPVAAIRTIFWDPLFGPASDYSRPQLLVKAAPLILLDELLELSDRFCALNEGRLSPPVPTEGLTLDRIGLMLGGAHGMEEARI